MQIHASGGLDNTDPLNRAALLAQQEAARDAEMAGSGSDSEEEEEDEELEDSAEEVEAVASVVSEQQGASKAPRKGMARIIRDADGNVVDIIEGEEMDPDAGRDPLKLSTRKPSSKGKGRASAPSAAAAATAAAPSSTTPWGEPLNDSSDEEESSGGPSGKKLTGVQRAKRDERLMLPVRSDDLAEGATRSAGARTRAAPTSAANPLHAALDELAAASAAPVPRYTSQQEGAWLRDLVRKHGDDYEAAARDRRANLWQKTAGELRRMVKKAGGIDALRA